MADGATLGIVLGRYSGIYLAALSEYKLVKSSKTSRAVMKGKRPLSSGELLSGFLLAIVAVAVLPHNLAVGGWIFTLLPLVFAAGIGMHMISLKSAGKLPQEDLSSKPALIGASVAVPTTLIYTIALYLKSPSPIALVFGGVLLIGALVICCTTALGIARIWDSIIMKKVEQ